MNLGKLTKIFADTAQNNFKGEMNFSHVLVLWLT